MFLIDRYQAAFPAAADCRFCYNLIYNSVPLSLHGFLGEMAENGAPLVRLDFLEESGRETEKILRLFSEGLSGSQVRPDYDFTTGALQERSAVTGMEQYIFAYSRYVTALLAVLYAALSAGRFFAAGRTGRTMGQGADGLHFSLAVCRLSDPVPENGGIRICCFSMPFPRLSCSPR